MKYFLACFILLISLGSCAKKDKRFEYIPLNKYKYEIANIKDGTAFQVVSYSGGPTCTPEETYYYQFIAVDKATSDTIRILSPCQTIENISDSAQGTFSPYADQSDMINKVLKENGEKGLDEGDKIVVFNKLYADLEKRPFRTAIGTLSFK